MKELTLSPNSLKVLSVLISSSQEQNFHTLASATTLSVMGISKIIKQLEQKKIVTITPFGKSHLVRLNRASANLLFFSLAEQYKFRVFLEKQPSLRGLLTQLKEKLSPLSDFSLIFGSYASGEESTRSDLDLLVVSSHKDKVLKTLKTISVALNRELSPVIVSAGEYGQKVQQGHRLYREIMSGKRIIISGEYDFWRLMLQV